MVWSDEEKVPPGHIMNFKVSSPMRSVNALKMFTILRTHCTLLPKASSQNLCSLIG